ncbi:MAG: hypothetical protein JSS70_18855 [Bacteroidetes bacterium]|nr:hypothetical protein [Bacteroidota bacterium]
MAQIRAALSKINTACMLKATHVNAHPVDPDAFGKYYGDNNSFNEKTKTCYELNQFYRKEW